jgi:G3E family GTPase
LVLDHLHTLNDLTPKIRCNGRDGVDPDLIFGLESKLFTMNDHQDLNKSAKHSDEVQVITLYRGRSCRKCRFHNHVHNHGDHSRVGCNHEPGDDAHDHLNGLDNFDHLSQDQLSSALKLLKKESVWRVKGFVRLSAGIRILNWAFGRFDLTETDSDKVLDGDDMVLLTVMGEQGEIKRAVRGLAVALGAEICT